jgi:EAL domain-containing protein (putative c-di-GMP-specific phosphodiesterase class I)
MTTIAEGVETATQLSWLQRVGCDESQGYLHSRPISAADFELLLTSKAGFLLSREPEDDSTLLQSATAS